MSSSPVAKATEKEHKGNKEDNFSPFLRSIGWKEEWAEKKSEICHGGWVIQTHKWSCV